MTPSVDELWVMLAKAHEAGNTADAEAIAGWIREIEGKKRRGIPEYKGVVETVIDELPKVGATAIAKASDGARSLIPGSGVLEWAANKIGVPDRVNDLYFDAEGVADRAGLAPETSGGKLAAEVLPAVVGGFGASAGAAGITGRIVNRWGRWGADNLVSSVGSQVASGNDVSLTTTAADTTFGTGLNAVASAISPRLGRAIRAVIRGKQDGETLASVQRINEKTRNTFTPSRAMLTQSPPTRFAEKHLENAWGSAGRFAEFNQANDAALNEFVDVLRKGMAGGDPLTSQDLGDAIQAGFKEYVDSGRANAEMYFTEAIQRAGRHRIRLTQTRQALNNVLAVARNNPSLEKVIVTPEFRALTEAITGATNGVDLQGAIRLKVAIRNAMDEPGLGLKKSNDRDLSNLYNALNDDVGHSLEVGAPFGASGAWIRANETWSEFQDDLSNLGQTLKDDGDRVYARLFGKPGEGLAVLNADRLRHVLAVLPEPMQKSVKAEIIYRAGLESAGQAGNEGRKFSAAAFLTNWTKLKEGGFDKLLDPEHRADLASLALVSSRMKDLGKAANFSNTANHLAGANILQGVAGMASGGFSVPITMLTNNLAARALLNPDFARAAWRYAGGVTGDSETAKALIRLVMIAESEPDTGEGIDALLGAIESQN